MLYSTRVLITVVVWIITDCMKPIANMKGVEDAFPDAMYKHTTKMPSAAINTQMSNGNVDKVVLHMVARGGFRLGARVVQMRTHVSGPLSEVPVAMTRCLLPP